MNGFKLGILGILILFGIHLQGQVAVKASLNALFSDTSERSVLQKKYASFLVLDSLYKQNAYKPIFTHGMAQMYLGYLKNSANWGFNIEDYQYQLLDSLNRSKNPSLKALFDIAVSNSYLVLYEDVLNGVLKNEKTRGSQIHFRLERFDSFLVLNQVIDLPSISYLKLLEPQILSYQETKTLLNSYLNSYDRFKASTIVFEDSLKLGDKDSLVVKLRERLVLLGDLKSTERKKSSIFDRDVEAALKGFQQRNLLDSTGILDLKTATKLNLDLALFIDELQINLERWRWLPNNLGSYYALAILPAFEMSLVKEDSLLLRQRIVCGKIGRYTPSFNATMSYIDINPTWTVPPTILQKDILPAAKRNASYLSNTNIKVLDVTTGTYVSGAAINWAKSGNYKFVQGPGLSNSLGVVKFIFPNDYYIFFHDTPHKEHFPLKVRAYSSGCVRLSQPIDFAEVLLKYNKETYSKAQIDSVVNAQKTKRVLLEQQPEVYIHYVTQESKDGLFYTYPDIYGYNKEVLLNFKAATKD